MSNIILANGQTCGEYMLSRGVKFEPDYNFFIKNMVPYTQNPLYPKETMLFAFAKHKGLLYADSGNEGYVVYGDSYENLAGELHSKLDGICIEWFGGELSSKGLITNEQCDTVYENESVFTQNQVLISDWADFISDNGEYEWDATDFWLHTEEEMYAIWQDEVEDEINEAHNDVLEKLCPNNALLAEICEKYSNNYHDKEQNSAAELVSIPRWTFRENGDMEVLKPAVFYIEEA